MAFAASLLLASLLTALLRRNAERPARCRRYASSREAASDRTAAAPAPAAEPATGDTPLPLQHPDRRCDHLSRQQYPEPLPLSYAEKPITERAFRARASRSGSEPGRQFRRPLLRAERGDLAEDGDVVAKAKDILKDGPTFIIADLQTRTFLQSPTYQRPRTPSS